MKLEICHLYRHFDYANWAHPIIIDVLKMWAEAIGWEVRVSVCREADVPLSGDADVVAFSVYTQTAPAAYRLGKALRNRGKIVVFGGPHFRGPFYREGLRHCDVVVDSISEAQWKGLLDDIEQDRIEPNSGNDALYIKETDKLFRYPENHLVAHTQESWWQVGSIPTSLFSAQMIYKKSRDAFSLGGLSMQAMGIAAYNIWSRLDAWRKERALKRNWAPQEALAGDLFPNVEVIPVRIDEQSRRVRM